MKKQMSLGQMTVVMALASGIMGNVAFGASTTVSALDVAVTNGQKIAFMGDSITAGGTAPKGYVTLVMKGLEANGIKAGCIPAGQNGSRSDDMPGRVEREVLIKKPDWMTLSCGVNDVWHGANGVQLDAYKINITKIVEQCQAVGVKVMILTATMIFEDPANQQNQKLIAYNEFLRTLAMTKKCLLADVNADMQAGIAKATEKKGNVYTADGVHMNDAGNVMMATSVLKAFGLNAAQLEKAQKSWTDAATSK